MNAPSARHFLGNASGATCYEPRLLSTDMNRTSVGPVRYQIGLAVRQGMRVVVLWGHRAVAVRAADITIIPQDPLALYQPGMHNILLMEGTRRLDLAARRIWCLKLPVMEPPPLNLTLSRSKPEEVARTNIGHRVIVDDNAAEACQSGVTSHSPWRWGGTGSRTYNHAR